MRFLFSVAVLVCVIQSSIIAQDLIIAINNDSIKCRIESIDADSSVYFKPKLKYDLYKEYLTREYYSKIVFDYYTKLKRSNNPGSSLGIISAGVHFPQIGSNPIIGKFFENEELLNDLSSGVSFSSSFQKFLNSIELPGNVSMGVSFGYFKKEVIASNIQLVYDLGSMAVFRNKIDPTDPNFNSVDVDLERQVNTLSLLISYNTPFEYSTYLTAKPGFLMSTYSGYVDNSPFNSRTLMFNMGISIQQKIADVRNKVSLFLVVEPFISATKTARINYLKATYYTPIKYYKTQYDNGYSVGLLLKYFY